VAVTGVTPENWSKNGVAPEFSEDMLDHPGVWQGTIGTEGLSIFHTSQVFPIWPRQDRRCALSVEWRIDPAVIKCTWLPVVKTTDRQDSWDVINRRADVSKDDRPTEQGPIWPPRILTCRRRAAACAVILLSSRAGGGSDPLEVGNFLEQLIDFALELGEGVRDPPGDSPRRTQAGGEPS
jgi:hypothetical protein